MEEAQVPAPAHGREKAHQCARALGELEAQQPLVAGAGAAADHEADVELRDLVARHVEHGEPREPRAAVLGRRRARFAAVEGEADEDVRLVLARVAIVELGDLTRLPSWLAEIAEGARALGDRHCEDRLAVLAELGALRHVAQPVEVHVGAAVDGDERAALRVLPLAPVRLRPATASAPAGSAIERVSSKMSLMAAQISSVSTVTHLVDVATWATRKGSSPIWRTATPSAKRPT